MIEINDTKWDVRFLRLAQEIATWSKDPSTKVGCVIVAPDRSIAALGYNGPGRFDVDEAVYSADRDEKLSRTIHSEMNAMMECDIPKSVRAECVVYSTFEPCENCTKHLLQYGFRRFVTIEATPEQNRRWHDSFARSRQMRRNAKAGMIYYGKEVVNGREDDATERDQGSPGA